MITTRQSLLTLALLTLSACGSGDASASLYLSTDKYTFDGRVDHIVLKVQAFAPTSAPGLGVVSFAAPAGTFAPSADVSLADGFATVTFSCDPTVNAACSGQLRLTASWAGQNAGVSIKVTPSTVDVPVNWSVVPTNSLSQLRALVAASDRTLWAAGDQGTVLTYSNQAWSQAPTTTVENLTAIALTDASEPMVVGERGTLQVWSGHEFTPLDTGLPDETFTCILAYSTTDALIGASSGKVYHLDGTKLAVAYDVKSPVLSLVRHEAEIWAGAEGAFAVLDQTGVWSTRQAPVLARYSVALETAEGLWVAGSRMDTTGGVLMLGPIDWKTVTMRDPITAVAVVPASDERFAISSSGVTRQLGTGAWSSVRAPIGGNAAVSRGAGDLVIVGAPGISLFRIP